MSKSFFRHIPPDFLKLLKQRNAQVQRTDELCPESLPIWGKLLHLVLTLPLNEAFLSQALSKLLVILCETLGFQRGSIMFASDASGCLPAKGEVARAITSLKVMAVVGWKMDTEPLIGSTLSLESIEGSTLLYVLREGKSLQIYSDPDYISSLEQKGVLRSNYLEYLRSSYEQDLMKNEFKSFDEYAFSTMFPLKREDAGNWETFGIISLEHGSENYKGALGPAEIKSIEELLEAVSLILLLSNLIGTVSTQNRTLDQAYTDLRDAQAAIILQEKLSSLGMLSASIAHGVHNPLFALSVSTRRLEELTNRLESDWQKLESQGLSAEDRRTLQELLTAVGHPPADQLTFLA